MPKKTGALLFVVGVGLMLCGLYRQEAVLVLEKAITICLQCIGIG
ncbi:MAG TPA: thioredoxin [Firmicutes bacterium]|nr:thioredoxin [Bacillota bacterium]